MHDDDAAEAARPPAPVLALVAGIAAAGKSGPAPPRRADPARPPSRAAPAPDRPAAAITAAAARRLVDAVQDGVALADADGTIALASTRLEAMFGYQPAELTGRTVASLLPACQHQARPGHQPSHIPPPAARPAGARPALAGRRKDGTTFPAQISHSPVTTAAGPFTLTIIRDITQTRQLDDLTRAAAAAAERARRDQHLLDTVITRLFHAGLSLQAAIDLPAEATRQQITQALDHLDDTIRQIRDSAFTTHDHDTSP